MFMNLYNDRRVSRIPMVAAPYGWFGHVNRKFIGKANVTETLFRGMLLKLELFFPTLNTLTCTDKIAKTNFLNAFG